MRFSAPEYLVLLAGLAWFWHIARRAPGTSGHRTALARGTIVLLLVLGISGLQIRRGASALAVMFVVDVSDSVMATYGSPLQQLSALTAGMKPGDRAGAVVFGANAALERRPDSRLAIAEITSTIRPEGSNIEAALRLARSALPRDGSRRLVLLSDGRQTAGEAQREAAFAAAEGVRIDVAMPREGSRIPRNVVSRLAAPPVALVGEPFALTAIVVGDPGSRGEVALYADAGPGLRQEVIIPAGGVVSAEFHDRQLQPGTYSYRAAVREFTALPELRPARDEGPFVGAVVTVRGERRLLYAAGGAETLVTRLARSGVLVDGANATSLPRSPQGFFAYDAVVLDDVPAGAIDATQSSALAQYVEQYGGGLLVLGSPRSLDAAFTANEVLSGLVPVDLRPRGGRRAPSAALVVVFDKSGSMDDRVEGTPKIEFARQAVRRVIESLSPTDAVGVIAFDAGAVTLAPLRAGHSPAGVSNSLRAIAPGGATAMAPALELAYEWLAGSAGEAFARRHVLLLSDGRTPAADATRARAAVQRGGYELSVISFGADVDRPFLTSLAEDTGGRAFFPRDARELPLIVAREASRVTSGRVVEEPFVIQPSAHAVLTGLDPGAWPSLGGYVVTAAKTASQAPLTSHLGDPVLATWQVGLGRVGVYTADLHSPWSAPLRAWNGFGPLFTQTIRWLSRQISHEALFASFQERGEGMSAVLDAQPPAGRILSLVDVRASMRLPSGEVAEMGLVPVAPGRYQTDLPVGEPGPYIVTFSASSVDGAFEGRIVRGFYWSAAREQRRGIDRPTLLALVETTGGHVLYSQDSPFTAARDLAYREAWPGLSLAAVFIFLADLLTPDVRTLKGMVSHWRRRRDQAAFDEDAA